MDKIIIKACLNGNKLRATNPNIPYSPKEVADEAVRCYEAGASIVISMQETKTVQFLTIQLGTKRQIL